MRIVLEERAFFTGVQDIQAMERPARSTDSVDSYKGLFYFTKYVNAFNDTGYSSSNGFTGDYGRQSNFNV